MSDNRFIGGETIVSFEARFADYCGAGCCVALNSGTDALRLALIALQLPPGSEVITTPFSFIAAVEAILQAGLRPRFADIDPDTLSLSAEGVAAQSRKETSCLIPVHFGGNPCEIHQLQNASGSILLLEDCCQAHGSRIHGRHVGTFGQAGAFSFYPTKNLGAWGDAGAVVTGDDGIAASLRRLRNHGQTGRYFHENQGWNSRLDALQAAVLSIKLDYLDQWNRERVRLAGLYDQGLDRVEEVTLVKKYATAEPVPYLYTLRVQRRDQLREFLQREGIETQVVYPYPLHLLPATRPLGYKKGDFPNSEKACAEVMSLPLYPGLKENDVQFICEKIRHFYR